MLYLHRTLPMDTLLKRIRNQKGDSTYVVAERLGISQGVYSHIELGHRTVTAEMAKKIAEYCGVPLEQACVLDSCRYRVANGEKLTRRKKKVG